MINIHSENSRAEALTKEEFLVDKVLMEPGRMAKGRRSVPVYEILFYLTLLRCPL